MAKYLDYTGLAHFWGKIKDFFKITTVSNVTTIHMGSNTVVPVTTVTAGAGLNTTSSDTSSDGGTIGNGTNNSGTLYLTKSGVTANSYGPSANATPNPTETFNVPYITVDKYGRITAASTKTVTIPAAPSSFNITVTDDLLDGTGGANSVKYAPYSSKVAGKLYSGSTDPTNNNRLNYDGYLYATNFGGKINEVSVNKATTGFTIAGGTTSKTLTVNESYTLGAACAKGILTTATSTDDSVPTSKAVLDAIAQALIGAAMFLGVIQSGTSLTALPSTGYKKGLYWIVGTGGTYAGVVCETGDTIFCVKDYVQGTASNNDFNVVQTNIETISTSEIDDIINPPANP